MAHPHQSFLDEYALAIKKLVPLTPPEIVEEAMELYKELTENEKVSEKQIHQALVLIGRKEYPYRIAYHELCATDEEKRLQKEVLDRVEEGVKQKLLEVIVHGVILEDYIRSPLFEEQLTGEERYQVENAVLLADDILDTQCDERAHQRQKSFEELVRTAKEKADKLQGLINELRRVAEENQVHHEEIMQTVYRLEEGWSVVEKDPEEKEILKEMEYWQTVIQEENEAEDFVSYEEDNFFDEG